MHPLPLHKLAPFLSGQSFQSTFPCTDFISTSDVATITSKNFVESDATTYEVETSDEKADNFESIPTVPNKGTKRKHCLTEAEKAVIRAERQRKRFNHQQQAWKSLETKDLDAVIVASKYAPFETIFCS